MIPKIQNILYATDLKRCSAYAFRYAINTMRNHHAKVHLLHVIEPISPYQKEEVLLYGMIDEEKFNRMHQDAIEILRRRFEERLKQFAESELTDDPETLKQVAGIHIVEGDPANEILNKVDEFSCDIVIMGTHGKGVIGHTFLGSVAEKVLRRIRKPVYIIPLPTECDINLPDIY